MEAEKPEVEPHQEWLWTTFWRLSQSRQMGMGEGPIPLSEIEAWCRLNGIHENDERAMLAEDIQELDREYLTIKAEQREREQAQHGNTSSRH